MRSTISKDHLFPVLTVFALITPLLFGAIASSPKSYLLITLLGVAYLLANVVHSLFKQQLTPARSIEFGLIAITAQLVSASFIL